MRINQQIEISWSPKNKQWFTDKGYVYTKRGDKFWVNISELQPKTKVDILCDGCNKSIKVKYERYKRCKESNIRLFCSDCIFLERQKSHYERVARICFDRGYTLITKQQDIINNQSEIEYICPLHGKTSTKITSLFQGKCCYKCSRINALKNKSKTTLKSRQTNLFNRASKIADNKGYTIITNRDDILNNISIIEYECFYHGKQRGRISNFISGKGCPKCAKEKLKEKNKLSSEQVTIKLSFFGGNILNKEDYINCTTKNLKIVCPECKSEIITTSLRNFTQHEGQVCDKCLKLGSHGERRIKKFLEKNKINFVREKRFENCCDIKTLPFDFYLPDYNLIIEYDGEQHYKDRAYKSGLFKDSLEYTQLHDKIKTDYCLNNNIKLIRIPYWDFNNIDDILTKQLYSYKDIV